MCGIFGVISKVKVNQKHLQSLANHARQRGKDSSGLCLYKDDSYKVIRADYDINKLLINSNISNSNIIFGHSRLITNGLFDNQPVVRDEIILVHNGIIVNEDEIWKNINVKRQFEIDSETIIALALDHLSKGKDLETLSEYIFSSSVGSISAALAFPKLGKLCLLSNNGSLYYGQLNNDFYFSSELFPLSELGCTETKQLVNDYIIVDIPTSNNLTISDKNIRSENLIPVFKNVLKEENLLIYPQHNLKRCTKCILPETMPYIYFDEKGVCNYCNNYRIRNKPKPKEEIFKLIEPYRKTTGAECIVPFSGGRDSCWGLHLIVNELKLKPITYTYDWGMVTDLGRRNISRMCSMMGVENIIIADDISLKRKNIARNLEAWLKSPHLGMISILTAGDKHFFRHVETVKKQTGLELNLWGVNPLEVTHFKAGFLGVPPDFEEKKVYSNGALKQLRYQSLRFKAMLESPGYFNKSLWDTISGEYYRSFTTKNDYFHIFDYWNWDENVCNDTLKQYDWELAPDTNTTWRIGDGTAAFYNYLYYTIAGFTEHDTFRSNQIREGQITREEALVLVKDENRPRYQNIRWYLDALSMDFESVIKRVNSIKKLY
ncbi:MAG: glucosamine 6-phosphate synthetase [Bacteroidia bacterium]|nr:glucosamine 6-phosphate synthetase [Bacteroidia bacterium]